MTQPDSLPFATQPPQRTGLIRRISVRYGGAKHRELERFIKFLCVGALGAVIDLGLTNILMAFVFRVQHGETLPTIAAGCIGFTVAVISNFTWNRYWTYPESRSRRIRFQLPQFFVVNTAGLLVRAVTLALLTPIFAGFVHLVAEYHWFNLNIADSLQWKIASNMAIMVALVIVAFWNFFVNRYWTYRHVK